MSGLKGDPGYCQRSHRVVDTVGATTTIFLIILLLSVTPFTTSNSQDKHHPPDLNTLHFVVVVTRHGARSPIWTFPKDKYPFNNTKYWPNGVHQLTEFGKWQTLQSGKELKARYKGFLKKDYVEKDILVAYNPFGRDHDSALCILAGLYPTQRHLDWCNKPTKGTPLVLREFDIAMLHKDSVCPSYSKEVSRLMKGLAEKEAVNIRSLSKNLKPYIGENIKDAIDVLRIYDTLTMQFQEGLPLPQWSRQIFPRKLQPVALSTLHSFTSGSQLMTRLGPGVEYKFLTDMMRDHLEGTSKAKKMYVEATHDTTISSLLDAVGHNITRLEVETGSYLVMELHKIKGRPSIKMFFFQNSHGTPPKKIRIKGCSSSCFLEEFNTFVESIYPKNFKEECNQ